MKKTVIPIFLLVVAISSCSKSDSGGNTGGSNCPSTAPTFAANVLPLVTSRCATNSSCHASGATNSGGVLTNYFQISGRKSNIRSQVSSGAMPQGSTLTSTEKNTIICWIDAGALNN